MIWIFDMIEMLLWSDGHKCINKIIKVKNLSLNPLSLSIFINSTSYQKYLSLTIRW
jgi:hypothetical protein